MDYDEQLQQAFELAEVTHRGQYRRYSGVPYIIHPLKVQECLSRWGVVNIDVHRAALLHDTLEDSKDKVKTEQQLSTLYYPEDVILYVHELTKPTNKKEAEDYYKNFHLARSPQSIIIKCADRVVNAIDYWHDVNPKKGVDYLCEMATMFIDVFTNKEKYDRAKVGISDIIKNDLPFKFPMGHVVEKIYDSCK